MKIVAGIDGGGTKTKVICQDLQGQTIAEEKFGAFNLNSIGEEGFTALMKQICEFLQNKGECVSLCIGAAGVSNPQMRGLVEQAMNQAGNRNGNWWVTTKSPSGAHWKETPAYRW